ncbi:MAG: TonB-dependent receptor [Bacteroidaceae bacterium]|nr:TonB-dependent receptor [Bacteroidaceae bacterium]
MQTKRLAFALTATLCIFTSHAQEAMDSLPEVVITATGTQHLLRDVPVQTEVISRRVLDSYGGKSIEEILNGLTTSFAFNEGDMGSQMQMGGLGNAYILILIDGKRIHGDVGGENDLGLIDPHDIDHIEIVKGAQSALYGSDAMAGVINIITRSAVDRANQADENTKGITFENATRYGSYNDLRHHNALALKWGRLTSQTRFSLQRTDGWQNTSREYTEAMIVPDSRNKTVNAYHNWQIQERLTYVLNPNVEMYAEGSHYTKTIERPRNGRYPSCDVYTYDLMYRNSSAAVGGKWRMNEGDVVTLDVDWNRHAYYYKYTATTLTDGYDPAGNFTNYYPYFAGQKNLQSDQQRMIAHAKGVFHLPASQLLSTGIEYRYDYLNAPMRTATGTADDWTLGAYAQDEFTPLSWLNITAGLRLNQNRNFGFRATPKLSAMIFMGDFRFRAGWSQGFKTPTTKELHYRYLHTMGSSTYYNLGNTNLDPQKSNYYTANVEYRANKLTASISGYYNKLDDMIALINVPLSEIPAGLTSAYGGDGSENIVARQYRNMEDARTEGVDINVSYKLNNDITFGGSYGYLNTVANEYDSTHDRLHRVTIDGTAHHRWSAFATWNHRFCKTYRLGLNLSTRGSSKRYYQNDGDGAAYQLWRINTTHEFGRQNKPFTYRVEAGVDNIFDYVDCAIHPYHLGTKNAGRTFYVSFSLRFHQGKNISTNKPFNNKQSNEDED